MPKKNIQHLRYYGRAGHFDQDNMIKPDAVVRVKKGKPPLNFVGLDHPFQNVTDCQGLALACEMIRDSKDST
jgi:hypothetical protein